jgi:hypothetical protein
MKGFGKGEAQTWVAFPAPMHSPYKVLALCYIYVGQAFALLRRCRNAVMEGAVKRGTVRPARCKDNCAFMLMQG